MASRKKPKLTEAERGFQAGQRWIESPDAADCTDAELNDQAHVQALFSSDPLAFEAGFLRGAESMLFLEPSVKPLPKRDIERIAEYMVDAARENAAQTVIDEHGGAARVKGEYGSIDVHPRYDEYFLATLEDALSHLWDYVPRELEGKREFADADLDRIIKTLETTEGLSFGRGGFRRRR